MLYELRRYDVAAGKLPALIDRFGSFTVHKWKDYGIRLVGFWTPLLGEKSNQVVYIWGWESFEERTKKMAAWRADPERARKWEESEKDGPLVKRVNNQLMEATSSFQLDKGERYGPDAAGRDPYLFELRSTRQCRGRLPTSSTASAASHATRSRSMDSVRSATGSIAWAGTITSSSTCSRGRA